MRVLENKVRRLEKFRRWIIDLFSNPHHSASQKLTAFALQRAYELHEEKVEEDGSYVPYLPELGEMVGQERHTVGTNLQALAKSGLISRKVVKTEPLKQRVEVKRNGLWTTPKQAYLEPRNHGGDRRCPNCGSLHLRKRPEQYTCEECGTVSIEMKGKLYA